MTTFSSLGLISPLQRAIAHEKYTRPTPIQAQAIPPLLEGRDVLGCAQTGTGKTAAFALPTLQLLAGSARRPGGGIRALILTPTRELAAQIGDSFAAYGRFVSLRHLVIFGGVGEMPQIRKLRRGVDILVATPGRLLDLRDRGHVDLSQVELFVLDEADRMLDMGFVHDVRKVLRHLPRDRQNLLFSATIPPSIAKLASSFLADPIKVEVTPEALTVEAIEQSVMFVDRPDKRRLLADILHRDTVERAIVFTRTKHGANRLAQQLERAGLSAAAIHGNKSQGARQRALDAFKRGATPVLIATDIASRGIDVDGVSHVFNYDLPNVPEVYVHRIGRTGRAGRSGVAISFCDATEGGYLRAIERTIGLEIPVVDGHAYHLPDAVPSPQPRPARKGRCSQRASQRPAQRSDKPRHPRSGQARSGKAQGERVAPRRSRSRRRKTRR